MPGPSVLTALLVLAVAAVVTVAVAPLIAADMRRALRNEDGTPPDLTMITMMGFGPGLWIGVAGVALWLGRTWA